MSEIKNGRLDLYGAEHSKCDRAMTLGFEGLNFSHTEQCFISTLDGTIYLLTCSLEPCSDGICFAS